MSTKSDAGLAKISLDNDFTFKHNVPLSLYFLKGLQKVQFCLLYTLFEKVGDFLKGWLFFSLKSLDLLHRIHIMTISLIKTVLKSYLYLNLFLSIFHACNTYISHFIHINEQCAPCTCVLQYMHLWPQTDSWPKITLLILYCHVLHNSSVPKGYNQHF